MIKSFLQSKEWEQFQNSVGNKTFRMDDVLLIKKNLPIGKSYFYAPRAEFRIKNEELRNFLEQIKKLAVKEKAIFLRIEPAQAFGEAVKPADQIKKVADVQPSRTIILNLEQSEGELLAGMRQKTRYNIRLAQKKGVKVKPAFTETSAGKESKDIEKFWSLMKETTERGGFRPHSRQYYEKMLQIDSEVASPSARNGPPAPLASAGKHTFARLYVAEYNQQVIAAGIFIFYNDTATYLHGASTHEHKEAMAPYLLHWEMIKLAKKEGCKYYDFYGIDEKKWPGVTRFKRGFSGQEVRYPGTFDVVFSKLWYLVYKIVRKLIKF